MYKQIMDTVQNIEELFERFGTTANFARAIGRDYQAVRKMRDRNSIHHSHWQSVIAAAQGIGVDNVTYEWLGEQMSKDSQPSKSEGEAA